MNEYASEEFKGDLLKIVHIDEASGTVFELIETQLERHAELEAIGARPVKGILFTGPPGTGKTHLAKIIANQSGANFYDISGPAIVSKWVGDTEGLLRKIFDHASSNDSGKSIIFFDEIDSIAESRTGDSHEASRRLVAQFLTLMDGFDTKNNATVVIAATNRADALDPALTRPATKPEVDSAGHREPLREFVYLDEVSLGSLLASQKGEITENITSQIGSELATEVGGKAQNANKVISKLLAGLIPVDGIVLDYVVVQYKGNKIIAHKDVIRDINIESQPLRIVGVADIFSEFAPDMARQIEAASRIAMIQSTSGKVDERVEPAAAHMALALARYKDALRRGTKGGICGG
uniref:AAA domain-containing protein n=1 Tax=Globodera pallida TaxID=36090 RepID=A0A183CN44_GLOPA